jgi:hypothetical protein
MKTQDGSITFYLDEQYRLLIKPNSVDYPFPLSEVDTLALANMLKIHYGDIALAALPFNGVKDRGRKDWV